MLGDGCYQTISKGKVPKIFVGIGNNLQVDVITLELEKLTDLETRLLSKVKIHMKICILSTKTDKNLFI